MQQRQTQQKEIIRSTLCRLGNHPTADMVYDAVHADYPRISRATVYRVLNQMADNGSALKISVTNGADRFDHNTFAHSHAKCTVCGAVTDVPLIKLDLRKIAPAAEGFQLTGYSLLLEGVCADCRSRGAHILKTDTH